MSELDEHKSRLRKYRREIKVLETRINEVKYLIREEQRIILSLRER